MRLATDPGEIVINDIRLLKRLDQRIVGTVNIANRDYSLYAREMPLICLRP